MKSKMNIKSILALTILAIISVMFLNISLAVNTAKIVVETANLRENASSDSKILIQIGLDEEVEVLEAPGEWCKVKYKDITGYIKTELLNIGNSEENNNEEKETESENTEQNQPEENTTITEETKNVEQEENQLGKYFVNDKTKIKLVPLINATDMIEVQQNQEVNVVKIINGWAYLEIEESNTRGWIRLEKLKSESQKKEEEEKKAAEEAAKAAEEEEKAKKEADLNAPAIKVSYVQTEILNLRKENNATSEIIGRLPQNTSVEVLSESEGWSKCRVNGLIGYISTQYLGSTKIEVTSRALTEPREAKETVQAEIPSSKTGSSVVEYAKQYLGSSYVYGATGPDSFDCSGFTSYIYEKFGVRLNRTAAGQYSNGTSVTELAPGDLVMFGSSSKGIYHVGIYMGGDTFIHAANKSRGVTTDRLSTYGNYYGARRVL